MKAAIFGSSGIIGQHMRLCVPPGIEPLWLRRNPDLMHIGLDLTNLSAAREYLESEQPDIVVNLAGESNTDIVERYPNENLAINVEVPQFLAQWCRNHNKHYIHISTQAVFNGGDPPYSALSPRLPINVYGRQKGAAEAAIEQIAGGWTIIRPTFILGVRPLPHVGRSNPVEQMLQGQPRQVCDRFFSILFACDAAQSIWDAVISKPAGTVQIGLSGCTSRYEIARKLGIEVNPVRHDDFPGIAPRPVNTAYWSKDLYTSELTAGLTQCRSDWNGKTSLDISERAREIAFFLGLREDKAFERLNRGFGAAHGDVATDFKAANPQSHDGILNWYRQTESYIWELSAYHADQGFNYTGMCKGIVERLKSLSAKRVLCLGDGIGDLTLSLNRAGIKAIYNDLAGSKTAKFAEFRYWMREGCELPACMNDGWMLNSNGGGYDAVVACDILEHVPDVPAWVAAIKQALAPGGWLMAQNAFGAGSGMSGSIPMHLTCNDRFEKDWDPLLFSMGFRQESSNWYQKL